MAFLNFIAEWWVVIAVAVIFIGAVCINFYSLWNGNIGEWLINVCAEMEKEFGGGTGFLKLRGAYDVFVAQFPVIAKLISFETFSKWVDDALAQLKHQICTNEKIKTYIDGNVLAAETAERESE